MADDPDSIAGVTAVSSHRRVVVVGAGTMGAGIVQTVLAAGASVLLVEADPIVRETVQGRIEGTIDADGDRRLETIGALCEPVDAELAIEAVPEDIDLKKQVLATIERFVPAACVIASNTSSLSIDGIAAALSTPGRFIGMHFFNPVPRSSLVELVVGADTDATTVRSARAWVELLGKEAIEVRDSPGFATSRLGVLIGLEAIRMVEEGVASAHDIDRGMELGYRFPMGPLRLTDLVGLDVRLAIADHLATAIGPRFEAPDLLRHMVERGDLGRKSGQGFFSWSR